MREYLPILIVGAIIGVFTIVFVALYALEKNKKKTMGYDRHMADGEIIRRLLAYAAPYKKEFALTLFVMLISIAYDILSPLLIGDIQALVKDSFELKDLFIRVAIYGGILVVSLICTYLQAMILQKTGQKILSQIREDVFVKVESLSHEQLNNIPVGKLVTRVANDPNAISYMFTNILVTLAKNIMVILGGYLLLFFVIVLALMYKRPALMEHKWICILGVLTIPAVWICSQAGWVLAEVGRQPWVIQDLMPTGVAVSDISSGSVQLTFWIFASLFTGLLVAEISILLVQIRKRSKADIQQAH